MKILTAKQWKTYKINENFNFDDSFDIIFETENEKNAKLALDPLLSNKFNSVTATVLDNKLYVRLDGANINQIIMAIKSSNIKGIFLKPTTINEEYTINADTIKKLFTEFENKNKGNQEVDFNEFLQLAKNIVAEAGLTGKIKSGQIEELAELIDGTWNGNKIGTPPNDVYKYIMPMYKDNA